MVNLFERTAAAVADDDETAQREASLLGMKDQGQASKKTRGLVNAFPSEIGTPPFITTFPGDVGS